MPFIFRPGGTNRPLLKQIPYYTAFNPLSIGGCRLWLDAADVSTITGTSPMTAWRDKSGVNTTPTYTGSPTYRTTSALRLGCVTFNGTTSFNSGTDSLYWSGFSLSQPFTVFVVATKRLSSNPNYSFIVEPSSGSGAVLLFANLQLSMYAGSADQYTNPILSFVANTTRLYSAVFNGSSSLLAYNGNATSPLSPGGNSWPGLYLGRDWSGAYDSGDYGEILFYNLALGTTQREQIESYLAQKWGLTTTLPSTHLNATRPAGIPAVSFINRKGFNLIAALLSGLMSTVYNLSSYSLAAIANSVSASSGTVSYIWTVAVPSGAKGKNAILMLFFNLYSLTNFLANQYFDYGIYVDGVAQGFGDTGTSRYIQTALGNYALNNGGITYGTNAMSPYQPLIIPLVLAAGATTIQLGIKNSQIGFSPVASTTLGYLSNNTTTTIGAGSNTSSFVPQTIFSTSGSNIYTVPSLCSAGAVTGVYIYCWGATGASYAGNSGSGGFASGYYPCAAGTVLKYIVALNDSLGNPNTGGSGPGNGPGGGSFSGVFLSNASGIVQSNVLVLAGGGGQSGGAQAGGGGGGGGIYLTNASGTGYSGSAGYIYSSGYTAITGGTLSAGGAGTYAGGALVGGGNSGGAAAGGGGYYGGGGQSGFNTNQAGGGGSSFVANTLSGATFLPGSTALSVGSNLMPPGGNSNAYYLLNSSYYGYGGCNIPNSSGYYGYGLVVIVPAVGTNPVNVGVSAQLYSA
jgi:hypothetical protein